MNALTTRTPFISLRREMDRLLDRFWEPEFPELRSLGEWNPALDVSETKDAVVVKAEVPGMDPKEIQVTLQDQTLAISGERKREEEKKDEHYYRLERSFGTFARSIRLPVPVDPAKVNANFRNGLLTVTLLKTPGARGASIPVKSD
jgi:HSP20 family protein